MRLRLNYCIIIDLTLTEFYLLALLLSHRGQAYSRQELLDRLWPDDVIVTFQRIASFPYFVRLIFPMKC